MPDTKITALAAIGANPIIPSTFPIPMVDLTDTSMAASGTTKKVTVNQILGAGGTATLASATITGDLTVRTDKLAVRSTGVGIGTTTPNASYILDLTTAYDARARQWIADSSFIGSGNLANGFTIRTLSGTTDGIRFLNYAQTTEFMRIDSTGNVGIGVTPSAWVNNTAVQLKNASSSITGAIYQGANGGANANGIAYNCYFDGTNWNYILGSAHPASRYQQAQGIHQWHIAPSSTGTATFTQAMTLDASGRLLVGTANASVTSETGCRLLLNNGATGHFTVAVTTNQSTAATSCYDFYSTSAAAYRFYVTSAGVINATNTTISAISDARLKENVQDIDVGLGAILALKPRKFDWKAGKGKDIKGDRGFIAQEFEQVFPQLVDEWKDPAPEGEAPYKSVRQDLIPVLVKAIQELAAEVNALKNA